MSTDPNSSLPAPSNVRGAAYPRIHPDLRVTFRVEAPTATTLQIQPGVQPEGAVSGLGAGPFDMRRDDAGVWIQVPRMTGRHGAGACMPSRLSCFTIRFRMGLSWHAPCCTPDCADARQAIVTRQANAGAVGASERFTP
jgi:hypothetical protein